MRDVTKAPKCQKAGGWSSETEPSAVCEKHGCRAVKSQDSEETSAVIKARAESSQENSGTDLNMPKHIAATIRETLLHLYKMEIRRQKKAKEPIC